MYINDLPDNLQSTVKLLADDILFSSMYEPNISASQLASDLKKKKFLHGHTNGKWPSVLTYSNKHKKLYFLER